MKRTLGAWALLAALVVGGRAEADCISTPSLCNLTVTTTTEQPDLDRAIDVVLVGDGFTDMTEWASRAANAIATFRSQSASTVYGAVPGVYNFHVVQVVSATNDVFDSDLTDTALGMNVSGPYINADGSRVATAALNAPDVDVVIAIARGTGRANAFYPSQLASGSTVRIGDPSPISHELGHALIHVADEYLESGLCFNPGEGITLTERNVTADATCTKFATTPGSVCTQGARYCASSMYRSAGACLMSSSGNSAPCPVCRKAIRDTLVEKKTGVDQADPWALVAAPFAGSTVTGTVRLRANVYDDYFRPTTVAFVVDGVFVGSAVAATTSAELDLDTTTLADGPHTLRLYPDDAAGHAGTSPPHTFSTLNQPAAGVTTLTLQTPLNGATVTGSTGVFGTATPTPTWLALLIDGTAVAMGTGGNLYFSWDTTSTTAGSHTISLSAADQRQNLVASPPITVTVTQDAGTGTQGFFAQIGRPGSWTAVNASFVLDFAAYGSSPATCELIVDGRVVMPNPLPVLMSAGGGTVGGEGSSGSAVIDASGWSVGPHVLEVRCVSGTMQATSQPVPVVRVSPGATPVALLLAPQAFALLRGTIWVSALGLDDVSVASLALEVDGVVVTMASGSAAMLPWNTTLAMAGRHRLRVSATDGAGNTGWSQPIDVVVDNLAPVVSITSPTGSAPARLGPVLVSFTDANSVGLVELLIDGVVGPTLVANRPSGTVVLPASLGAGSHTLRARATDRAGNPGLSAIVTVAAADCTAASCDDGKSCTVDTCGATGLCTHFAPAECCITQAECVDADPCTTDACNAGACTHAAVPGCCTSGNGCSDGQRCTLDRCSGPGGTCSHPSAGCCTGVADCDDGNTCTADSCLGSPDGGCLHERIGTCCRANPDCDDGNTCTSEVCTAGNCVTTPVAGCCNTPTDCDDGVVCTFNTCVNHVCSFPPRSNCCTGPADCTTLNPCATTACQTTTTSCVATPIPGCCTFDFECDDRMGCTLDRCVNASCVHLQSCCTSSSQCNDLRSCTTDTCNLDGGTCDFSAIAGCCMTNADCDDLNACTTNTCAGGTCMTTAVAACCRTGADCDDGDACTTDGCALNACTHAAVAMCCTAGTQCDDANACTTDNCAQNACAHAVVANCCQGPGDCDDGNVCTTDGCAQNVCSHANVSGCCTQSSACDDGDVCTADACTSNACTHTATGTCACTQDSECDDGNSCTTDRCSSNSCTHVSTGACACTQDSQCDDGNACTADACTQNACAHLTLAACCTLDGQCASGERCAQNQCVAGEGGPDGGGSPTEPVRGGCGCSALEGVAAWGLLLLLGFTVSRRRAAP